MMTVEESIENKISETTNSFFKIKDSTSLSGGSISESQKLFGEDGALVLEHSSMAGEDFSLFALGVPGSMFWIGSKSDEHERYYRTGNNLHNPNFEVDDRMLPRGAAFLSSAAIEYLKRFKTASMSDEL